MPKDHVIAIDPSRPLGEEPRTGHNRWHEAIAPVVEVDPGDRVVYEKRDAVDGCAEHARDRPPSARHIRVNAAYDRAVNHRGRASASAAGWGTSIWSNESESPARSS